MTPKHSYSPQAEEDLNEAKKVYTFYENLHHNHMVMKKYNLVVCGGTFDHFHRGHREFLRHILSISRRVLIGLTTDKFVKSKNNSQWVESYQLRKRKIMEFLDKEKAINTVQIEPIDDIYIPKIWENLPIEAIVVSENTIKGAEAINSKRKEQGKSLLKIEIVPLVKYQNNEYISSSRIRNGEINKEGVPYIDPIWLEKRLVIPLELRKDLKKPFGLLFRDPQKVKIPKCACLITVGDVTTKIFNELKLNQNISVIDFKVARKKEFSNLLQLGFSSKIKVINAKNPAGRLTPSLFSKVISIFSLYKNERVVLKIEGEEDLAVLPFILIAPLNSIIFYGQPAQGLVRVEVSEENKEKTYGLVSRAILEDIDK
ncbi:MAG: pantetheine-phosphate adenylyltransferase [Patescibacteria group bacterium]